MQVGPLRFQTIAVATDLSEGSSLAFRYAQTVAHQHRSTLVLVHVIDPINYAFPKGVPSSFTSDQFAREEMRRMEQETLRRGIVVHSVIESGIICERIVQTLVDHHADLLILGTKAKTGAGRMALGTVARQLLAKAPCPILAVPCDADAALHWAGQWRRVLAGTDFSVTSLSALDLAQHITYRQLIVLHVAASSNEHACSEQLERLRFLAPFNESHTIPVNHLVVPGKPEEVIAEYARTFDVDLVVLGSRTKELSAEEFAGSTVLQVISNVSCPVLCVPPARTTTAADMVQENALAC